MTTMDELYNNFIGIDIAKSTFVIAISNNNKIMTYKSFLTYSLIVLETTGGYETELVNFLLSKKCAVHRAHAQKVKYFISSLGTRAKTDSVDAQALVKYGQERHKELSLQQKPDQKMGKLKIFLSRRDYLLTLRREKKSWIKITM